MVLLQATERLEQTVLPIARDRLRLALPPRLELAARDPRPLAPPATPATPAEHQLGIHLHILLGLLRPDRAALALLDPPLGVGERGLAALRGAQLLGQLIAPRIAVELILTPVGLLGLAQDLPDHARVGAVLIHRRVRLDLRPVDHDHPDRHQPRLPAQPQHLIKQLGDLGLVPAAELRDRRVIRHPHARDHLVRHILKARPLDPTRRPIPARIRVQKQSHQHRRVIRSTTRPTQPIPLPETGPDPSDQPPPSTVHTK